MSDSTTQRCDRYDCDPATGEISNRETFFALGPADGFVDGAAVDSEGGYWATLVYAGRLRRYLPDGTLDLEIELPFDNPTKPAFGGDAFAHGLRDLDQRNAWATGPANPLDGGLFAFEADVAGLPEPLFAGIGG